jgi:hypothetical protein
MSSAKLVSVQGLYGWSGVLHLTMPPKPKKQNMVAIRKSTPTSFVTTHTKQLRIDHSDTNIRKCEIDKHNFLLVNVQAKNQDPI